MAKAKKIRIQKLLSTIGIASRRAVEQMVLEGRVSVNGRTRTKLPVLIHQGSDEICVDGMMVDITPPDKVYYLLNKPQGTVCTQQDPAGRRRAIDLIREAPQGVHCVGRLDMDSTGLIVMTNDGDLTDYLTHPKHGIPKTYVVEIAGRLDEQQMASLKAPAYLDGRKTSGLQVKSLRRGYDRSVLEITLREGRNREIRRLLARLGHKVFKLKRTAIGTLTDRGVKVGNFRVLKRNEVDRLFKTALDTDTTETPATTRPSRQKQRPTPKQKTVRRKSSARSSGKPVSQRGGDRKKSSRAARPQRGKGRKNTSRSPKVKNRRRPK
ncbi:MAG: rRNA pseudouridine synthase [bacterium]|nr:rRNA pseudouridine synthase [bacterium]